MDDTLPLAPPPSIRAPEAARRRDGDGGGGGRKGGRDAPPFETVATRGAVELEPDRKINRVMLEKAEAAANN